MGCGASARRQALEDDEDGSFGCRRRLSCEQADDLLSVAAEPPRTHHMRPPALGIGTLMGCSTASPDSPAGGRYSWEDDAAQQRTPSPTPAQMRPAGPSSLLKSLSNSPLLGRRAHSPSSGGSSPTDSGRATPPTLQQPSPNLLSRRMHPGSWSPLHGQRSGSTSPKVRRDGSSSPLARTAGTSSPLAQPVERSPSAAYVRTQRTLQSPLTRNAVTGSASPSRKSMLSREGRWSRESNDGEERIAVTRADKDGMVRIDDQARNVLFAPAASHPPAPSLFPNASHL